MTTRGNDAATDRPGSGRPAPPNAARLLLPDRATLADLRRLAARAARVDPGGAVRLLCQRDVLATYVAPIHGAGGPTVLGLRVLRLAEPCALDLTTSLMALQERLAEVDVSASGDAAGSAAASGEGSSLGGDGTSGVGRRLPLALRLDLPPTGPATAPWAGVSPPRSGWEPVGLLDVAELRATVAAGVAEIVNGTPPTAGGAQVAALRARVWARSLTDRVAGVPSGLAFAADALAFLDDAEPAALYRCGPWSRLSTSRGHALARPPLSGVGTIRTSPAVAS